MTYLFDSVFRTKKDTPRIFDIPALQKIILEPWTLESFRVGPQPQGRFYEFLDFLGRRPLSVRDHVVLIKGGPQCYIKCRKSCDSTFDEKRQKLVLTPTFHRSSSVTSGLAKLWTYNMSHIIKHLGTVLYRNHVVPDRQGSAAHEIPNHWISPSQSSFKRSSANVKSENNMKNGIVILLALVSSIEMVQMTIWVSL